MENMTLENIAAACGGRYYGDKGLLQKEIEGVELDSRKIEKDFLFLATVGERVDGHDFIAQVFEKGAACVICEKQPAETYGPCILVESSFQALKDIAEYYRKQLSVYVVGITGSVGKTSTKEAIASVLKQKYNVLKTQGNFNNEVGLPLTVLRIRKEHEIAVLEMGISDFGEMERLSRIAKPDICVMTNIGLCHLENLKTQEGILKAKSEIFLHMNPAGSVILNGDDPLLGQIKEVNKMTPLTFGLGQQNTVYACGVESRGLDGSSFVLCDRWGEYPVVTSLPGSHMVLNFAAAALVGNVLGLNHQEIQEGIAAAEPVSGRGRLIHTDGLTVIDDCYNANPVSMKAAIDLLVNADTRKVAILGDMFELGEDSARMHEETGTYAAQKGIDLLLCAGTQSKYMADGARRILPEGAVLYFQTAQELCEALAYCMKKGDSCLVKASHGMHYETIVQKLKDHVF